MANKTIPEEIQRHIILRHKKPFLFLEGNRGPHTSIGIHVDEVTEMSDAELFHEKRFVDDAKNLFFV